MTDLQRLAAAIQKFGMETDIDPSGDIELTTENGGWTYWDGQSENGEALIIFRDQVRRVAPYASCIFDGQHGIDFDWTEREFSELKIPPIAPKDSTETAAWKNALMLLAEAGIVP